jgi:hypothetical protein
MIKRELTNTYLTSFDLLTEALYLCWTNSFCDVTEQLNKNKLREQIRSYGFYNHKYAIKKEKPINFVNNFEFKTLVWVNKFSNAVNQDALCSYIPSYIGGEASKEGTLNQMIADLFKYHKQKVNLSFYPKMNEDKPLEEVLTEETIIELQTI